MRKFFKWTSIVLGSLVGLALAAAAALYFVGRAKLNRTYTAANLLRSAPAGAEAVARGGRLARTHGCVGCHGENLGGKPFLDIPPGRIVASNLTAGRGGVGGAYNDEDWDRAIRYGLRPDGRMILPFMPYRLYHRFSDDDAGALIAYLKTLPEVDSDLPATEVRLPGYFMMALAGEDELRAGLGGPRPAAPPPGPTAAYGAYLASTSCVECHGEKLEGGRHPAPAAPPGPELSHAGLWSFEEFDRALRQGVAPGGRRMSEWMPSDGFRHFTDDEVRALYLHLQSLAPKAAGR
jgi:mono/diheme cytochrome c family protein